MTAPAATAAPPTTTAAQPRPLFGGYTLVACVAAWLAGIALRQVGPLAALAPLIWLALAAVVLLIAVAAGIANRRLASHVLRVGFAIALLALFAALGAARAASADPSADPHAIARLANGQQVRLRGVVATEPDLRDGYRFLTVETGAVSLDGGRTYQTATGRVEATVYGPDTCYPGPMFMSHLSRYIGSFSVRFRSSGRHRRMHPVARKLCSVGAHNVLSSLKAARYGSTTGMGGISNMLKGKGSQRFGCCLAVGPSARLVMGPVPGRLSAAWADFSSRFARDAHSARVLDTFWRIGGGTGGNTANWGQE